MSRRRFVLVGCILFFAGVLLWVGWWWKMKWGKQDCKGVVIAILKRRVDYVQHDKQGLQRFAVDYEKLVVVNSYLRDRLLKCALFLPVYGLFDSWLMRSSYSDGYLGILEPVVSTYLLSANFFDRTTGEPDYSKVLNYQPGGLQAANVCGNPWANLEVEN